MSYRSLLFVPGVRPDRFSRAVASGADCVCIDLEDATPVGQKDAARAYAAQFLVEAEHRAVVGVRINVLSSAHGRADVEALAQSAAFLLAPKVGAASDLDVAAPWVDGARKVWPLIESAEGVMNAWEIANHSLAAGAMFGAFDYAADVGCDVSWDALLYARGAFIAACGRARIEALDAPPSSITDHEGVEQSTRKARAMGFTGRACIHPAQLAPIHAAFTPSEAEVEHARKVVEAFTAAQGGAAQVDGVFVDLPVALAARRTLKRVGL
jgi:citrate lyase subunit beta/citryl-CoA lyase/(S)-citramalyl-CoA lyase